MIIKPQMNSDETDLCYECSCQLDEVILGMTPTAIDLVCTTDN